MGKTLPLSLSPCGSPPHPESPETLVCLLARKREELKRSWAGTLQEQAGDADAVRRATLLRAFSPSASASAPVFPSTWEPLQRVCVVFLGPPREVPVLHARVPEEGRSTGSSPPPSQAWTPKFLQRRNRSQLLTCVREQLVPGGRRIAARAGRGKTIGEEALGKAGRGRTLQTHSTASSFPVSHRLFPGRSFPTPASPQQQAPPLLLPQAVRVPELCVVIFCPVRQVNPIIPPRLEFLRALNLVGSPTPSAHLLLVPSPNLKSAVCPVCPALGIVSSEQFYSPPDAVGLPAPPRAVMIAASRGASPMSLGRSPSTTRHVFLTLGR